MSEFGLYWELGLTHIADWNGYDHILFIVALCLGYQYKDWKKLLVLVTAFTVGHSITLALATFKIVQIDSALIEFLIPISIIITCLLPEQQAIPRYLLTTFFGLIHGLGFSNYLSVLLAKTESVLLPLLAFNVGLEVGQLLIVSLFLGITSVFVGIFKLKMRHWAFIVSSIVLVFAIYLLKEKWIF